MAGAMIELEGVCKAFPGGPSVGPLSLSIDAGTFVALLGGSGAGKTTTLKMINSLVAPDTGTVRVAGLAADAEPVHLRRRRFGYVFQEIGLFPHLTVAENIAVGPRLAEWDKTRTAERVKQLLALTALPTDAGDRMPSELSGGQRQRVGLARALAAEPGVMLMDEPFGALDPIVREALGRDYRDLHAKLGLTTVLVTHDVTEALLLADRIVVMEAGRIVADGVPAALLGDGQPAAVRALMDTPQRMARAVETLARSGEGDGRG
jgi:osmoprotectant transport system ATP-binding protein